MKPLFANLDNHPVPTIIVGALSGIGGWLLKAFHAGASVAADVGLYAGGCTAVLGMVIAIRKLCRDWREERAHRAFVDRLCRRREPFEDGMP